MDNFLFFSKKKKQNRGDKQNQSNISQVQGEESKQIINDVCVIDKQRPTMHVFYKKLLKGASQHLKM